MSSPSRNSIFTKQPSSAIPIYTVGGSSQRPGPTKAQETAAKQADKVAPLDAADNAARRAASAAASELETQKARERVTASRRQAVELAGQRTATTLTQSRQTQPIPFRRPSGTQPTSVGSNAPWTLAGGGTEHSWLRRDGEQLPKSGDDSERHW